MSSKIENAVRQFNALPFEERSKYQGLEDYLAASAQALCERCGGIVEYDELDENELCLDCRDNPVSDR